MWDKSSRARSPLPTDHLYYNLVYTVDTRVGVRISRIVGLVAAATLSVGAPRRSAAQTGYGTITGVARGAGDGAPIPFALIRLSSVAQPATSVAVILTDG